MYSKILVPVAPNQRPNTLDALKIAEKLKDEGGQIIALSVVEPIPTYAEVQIPESALRLTRDGVLEGLQASLGGIEAEAVVEIGHAGRSILDYAEANGVDCIVIASHDPGLQDYFLGGTAARVVRHAHCAVHVVR